MRSPWLRGRDDDDVARSAASARDERLSAYLDGELTGLRRVDVEEEVQRDAETREALEGMRAVRSSLGALGVVRAPRSFAIAPAQASRSRSLPVRGLPGRGLPRIELYMRLGTVAAALMLAAVLVLPSTGGGADTASESLTAASNEASSEAADAASPATGLAQKRAADATGAAGAAGEAQAPGAVPENAGTQSLAPAAAPALPAAAPEGSPPGIEPFMTPSDTAAEAPLPSAQPVPLSNGSPGQAAGEDSFWMVQAALGALTGVLATATLLLWLRRRRASRTW